MESHARRLGVDEFGEPTRGDSPVSGPHGSVVVMVDGDHEGRFTTTEQRLNVDAAIYQGFGHGHLISSGRRDRTRT